ncbi:MAG TPA: sugar ABC transporter permease, partial [Inquilinus sp.]
IREPISFLGQETTAFIATVVVDAWLGIPFMVVTLMAGLQRIPDDTIEAARIDGAGPVQIFRRITLPLLRPVLMTCVLLSTVWTFNSFQVIWPLTKGGPAGATATLPIQIYETAFGNFDFGTSSAMAVVIFVILMTVSLLYWRVLKGGEE